VKLLWECVVQNDMIIRILLVMSTASCLALGQSADQSARFRLAQSYEQAGNFEDAAKVYQQLYNEDPTNYPYFDGLRRVQMQLKNYDIIERLIQRRLAVDPRDVSLLSMLGGVYYKAGREREAEDTWEKTLATDPKNPNVYRVVTNVLLENRLLEKTAETYRRARAACGDPNLFTLDLAQLLAITMDYAGATVEFLRWLKQNPTQLAFVQGRMAAFTGKEEGREAALEVVKTELKKDDDIRLLELTSWLYLEGKNYDDAFETCKKIDRATNAKGASLYTFAERAFKEKAFDVAARAYREAINTPIASARLPYAKYGYACCLKELSALSDTLSIRVTSGSIPVSEAQPIYAGATAYFREIIKEYPRSEFSARSYFQIGIIQFQRFFDLDGALHSFESVEREVPGPAVVLHDVSIKIGEVLTAKGDTARASQKFLTVINAPDATPDQQDEATYRLAEIEYFAGQFEAASHHLESITSNLKADYANDALALLAFLQENQATTVAALKDFARADFLSRQRKNTEAIPIFLDVIKRFPQALLVDDALMKVGALQAQARLFTDAIASYERLIAEFGQTSIALDRARYNIAEIYQFGLHDTPKAIAAYERLLAEYPQSLLVAQARKRIRQLRGDAL
jgi:tetratricopeptide (TPR) repeat protein